MADTKENNGGDTDLKLWELLKQAVLWNCSTGRIEKNDGSDPKETKPLVYKGNVTEIGLL